MKPKFILGVGAQKTGTTWLHAMLTKQRNVNLGFMKEYHIWDAKFNSLSRNYRASAGKFESAENALRRMMQTDDKFYVDYFRSLIDDAVNITGDITPAYSFLGPDDFTHIRTLLVGAGFDVKVVYLMRDPVERVWSALRMHQRNANRNGVVISDQNLIDSFIAEVCNPQNLERSNYVGTVRNLNFAFEAEEVFYGFYENLFSIDSIAKLGDFIGVNMANVEFDKRLNSSRSVVIPVSKLREARELLELQYSGCAELFPEVVDLWENF